MIDNALGFREFSVADAWTGESRLDPRILKGFERTATAIFGDNAFKVAVTSEKLWQAGVSMAKQTIVIRSVIVPVANLLSNQVQLMSLGVPMRHIYKGMTTKLVEIDKHLKHKQRRVEIQAEMAANKGNPTVMRRLEAELQAIEDADSRMSIAPLIKEGEFSTISEGLTEADAAISGGKWSEYVQNLADRIPAKLGTAGRYAMITRDTALFQGMSRAVQYGDFLAKAVLYDHLIKQEGMSHEKAIERITEEFVNYNLQAGRSRSYLESVGLTWFWAFKIRSMKVALNHVRNHPLRALLANVGAGQGVDIPGVNVGSPITDNMGSVIANGPWFSL